MLQIFLSDKYFFGRLVHLTHPFCLKNSKLSYIGSMCIPFETSELLYPVYLNEAYMNEQVTYLNGVFRLGNPFPSYIFFLLSAVGKWNRQFRSAFVLNPRIM